VNVRSSFFLGSFAMRPFACQVLLAATSVLGLVGSAHAADDAKPVDAQGNLRVPADYRTSYEYLGSWAVAGGPGKGSKELHTVYASPGTVGAYQKSGNFPQDAVLVKEVFDASTAIMSTGQASRAETLKGWFVMIRDTKASHPENKLWGDGWGWSWFDVGNPNKTTSTNYRTDCQGCHVPARSTDWIYIQGYPSLKH
jgi:hypothetical protein